MAYDKVLELGSGSCSPPPKTTDTPLTRCCCRTTTETQDNETAILSKWRTSHTVRLPKFFNVTRQTSGDCHHDFRLGFSSGRRLKRSAPDFLETNRGDPCATVTIVGDSATHGPWCGSRNRGIVGVWIPWCGQTGCLWTSHLTSSPLSCSLRCRACCCLEVFASCRNPNFTTVIRNPYHHAAVPRPLTRIF